MTPPEGGAGQGLLGSLLQRLGLWKSGSEGSAMRQHAELDIILDEEDQPGSQAAAAGPSELNGEEQARLYGERAEGDRGCTGMRGVR